MSIGVFFNLKHLGFPTIHMLHVETLGLFKVAPCCTTCFGASGLPLPDLLSLESLVLSTFVHGARAKLGQ